MALFGFFDYQKSGKGIAKNEPEKKAFFKFGELFGRKFWKLLYINFIYVLFCSPLFAAFFVVLSTLNPYYFLIGIPAFFTFGPATVALTQVMRKFVIEQPIFVFDEFWKAFRRNFKQGLIIGIFDIIFIVCFIFAYMYYDWLTIIEPTFANIMLMAATIASGSVIWIMHFYIYPQIATLTLSLSKIIKNALFFTVLGLKGNIVSFIFSALLIIGVIITMPFSVFILPFAPFAWICFLSVFNAYPVIQKYVITPYYEAKGERNPELPDYCFEAENENEKPLFEDFGGREAEIKSKPKIKGKVIK